MVGTLRSVVTDLPTVPLPRRPLDPGDEIRRWYENELGWPTVPGRTAHPGGRSTRRVPGGPGIPVRLRVGVRFDVLDVPAEAGRAALRHLAAGSPVALQGGRMRLLVAAGSAEELPGVLAWLEWGTLPLDLMVIGEGGVMDAPPPPGPGARTTTRPLRDSGPAVDVPGGYGAERSAAAPGGVQQCAVGQGAVSRDVAAPEIAAQEAASRDAQETAAQGPGRPGAAVWLRPPEPGCEVEASLPTVSAMGGGGGTPDLVRVLSTVATHCHRLRLGRAGARPPVVPRARR